MDNIQEWLKEGSSCGSCLRYGIVCEDGYAIDYLKAVGVSFTPYDVPSVSERGQTKKKSVEDQVIEEINVSSILIVSPSLFVLH